MAFYMVKTFARFASRHRLPIQSLLAVARRVASGEADVDLGGGLYKQRVARAGGGKSGGFRTLLAHRQGGHVFFLHGFPKNERSTIDSREAHALKALGKVLHDLSGEQLTQALAGGALLELNDDHSP